MDWLWPHCTTHSSETTVNKTALEKRREELASPDAGSQGSTLTGNAAGGSDVIKAPWHSHCPCWMSGTDKVRSSAVVLPALPLCLLTARARTSCHGQVPPHRCPAQRAHGADPLQGTSLRLPRVCCVTLCQWLLCLKRQQTIPCPCLIFILDFMRKSNCFSLISLTD